MAATDAAAAVARAQDAVDRAVRELAAASARTETLAEYVPARRVLGLPRAARMTVIGDVWRLGVLLLDTDGRVYATGRVIRAERAVRKSVIAESVAEHRSYRAAAVKGGIAEGTTVVFDARPIDLDAAALADAAASATAPVVLAAGAEPQVAVRWDPRRVDAVVPFESYLAERVDLLAHPPQGA